MEFYGRTQEETKYDFFKMIIFETEKEEILDIIKQRWEKERKASTYRSIIEEYKRRYPKADLRWRESSMERMIRGLAQKGEIIRAYVGKSPIFFPKDVPLFELPKDWLR